MARQVHSIGNSLENEIGGLMKFGLIVRKLKKISGRPTFGSEGLGPSGLEADLFSFWLFSALSTNAELPTPNFLSSSLIDNFKIVMIAKNAMPAPAGDFLHHSCFAHGL